MGSAALTSASEEVGPREELASAHVGVASTLNADGHAKSEEGRSHGLWEVRKRGMESAAATCVCLCADTFCSGNDTCAHLDAGSDKGVERLFARKRDEGVCS